MTLAEYLLQARTDRKYTIRELAEKSGISTAEVSRLESGKHVRPSPGVLKALADALAINYPVLMQLAGYMEEVSEGEKAVKRVYRDLNGDIVDIVVGANDMMDQDEEWATAAFRVSRNLGPEDRKMLTALVNTYLEKRRCELAEQDGK